MHSFWWIFFLLLLGAALFFAAGFFAASLRLSSNGVLPSLESVPPLQIPAPPKDIHTEAKRPEDALAASSQLVHSLQADLSFQKDRIQSLLSQIAEKDRQILASQAAFAESSASYQTSLSSQKDEIASLQKSLATSQKDTLLTKQSLQNEASRSSKDQDSHLGQILSLQNEIFLLKKSLQSEIEDRIPREEIDKLKRQKDTAERDTSQLKQRIFELEAIALEKKRIEINLQTYDKLQEEAVAMRQRIAELEAHLFFFRFRDLPKRQIPPKPSSKPLDSQPRDQIGGWHLARFRGSQRYAVGLADGLGLPLLYEGEKDMEASLPLASALLQDAVEKALALLPLGPPLALDLFTEKEHGLRLRFFDLHHERFSLASVEQLPFPAPPDSDSLLSALSSLL